MSEPANQRTRVDLAPIKALLDRIREGCHPRAIWLFGSRAKGSAGPDSDWDLLVVLPDSVSYEDEDKLVNASKLRRDCRVNADIIPCRESDFLAASTVPNTLAYEVGLTGFPIYES